MKSKIPTNRGGLILWVLIIVVALLVLSYYGFSLRTLVSGPGYPGQFQLCSHLYGERLG